jgi:hypothetical protein
VTKNVVEIHSVSEEGHDIKSDYEIEDNKSQSSFQDAKTFVKGSMKESMKGKEGGRPNSKLAASQVE